MTPDLDLFRPNRRERRKHRNLDVQLPQFFAAHCWKSRIAQRCARGTTHCSVSQRLITFGRAYAPPQLTLHVQRDEHTSPLAKNSLIWNCFRKFPADDRLDNRLARQNQQILTINLREVRHPVTSCGFPACSAAAAA